MKKSYYILLTVTAAFVVLYMLGTWVGRGFKQNKQQVTRIIHEAFGHTTDVYEADSTKDLSVLFRSELDKAGLDRIRFRMDTVLLQGDSVVLKQDLRYFSDYEKLLDQRRTFVCPINDTQGVYASILNFRAEFIGKLLYSFFATLLALALLLYSISKQVNIIRRQDELAQMREDFSYAMIHDMKTPLSTIMIGLNLLQSGKLDDKSEKKEKYFNILEKESKHLLALTNRVLTLSKLEHEQLLLEKDFISLRSLLEPLISTFTAKAGKPVSFRLNLKEEGVYADEEFLSEALSNLIDNAIKYSKDEVEIQISSCLHNGYTQIKVRDNGIGIPLAAQRSVFDKFERVLAKPDGSTEKIAGFGLGLSYVMNVARTHGGYVSVESQEGKYSEFTVSLPLPPEL